MLERLPFKASLRRVPVSGNWSGDKRGAGAFGFNIDDAACTSTVRSKRAAPVVVEVEARNWFRIPVSKSSLMSDVQLYFPICCMGGPSVVGKVITVGRALAVALVEDEADARLAELTTEDALATEFDCDASCRRPKPRLLSGAAVDSGIFAVTVFVEAETRNPELVETIPLLWSPLVPGCSTGHRLQVD
jgi:hypothetical protein